MSIGRIQAGAAAIKVILDNDQFKKDWSALRSNLSKINRTLFGIGSAATATGLALGGAFGFFVRSAAEAESAINRFNLIFAQNAQAMRNELMKLSESTGVSMTTLESQASAFGAILGELKNTAGVDAFVGVVAKAQKAVVDLSGMGVTVEDAAARVKSALTSTGEAVDQFGWNLRQAELQNAVAALGIQKNIRQLTELEKQLVKIQLIEDAVRTGNLDFINTLDTLNSRIQVFRTQLQELWTNVSAALLPVLWGVVIVFTAVVRLLNAPIIRTIVSIVGAIAAVFTLLLLTFGPLLLAAAALLASFTYLMATFQGTTAAAATLSTTLAAMKVHVATLAAKYAGLTAWLLRAAAAMRAFSLAMFSNPIGWILGGAMVGTAVALQMGQTARYPKTARLEDFVAAAEKRRKSWLQGFPFGLGSPGLGGSDLDAITREAQSMLLEEERLRRARVSPAGARGIVGTRMINQQLRYGMGGGTPTEQTAQNTSQLVKIAEQVLGRDGASVKTEQNA